MASLIVPKWMRSEFRSDIITRPTNGVKLAPAHNKLRPYAYKAYGILPECEECKNGLKTAVCQIDQPPFCCQINLSPNCG